MAAQKPRKDQRKPDPKSRWLEAHKRRRRRGPSVGPRVVIAQDGDGRVKMSEVLEDFVEPYLDLVAAGGEGGLKKLFTIAVLAWNAAIQPEDTRETMIVDVLGSALHNAPELWEDARTLVQEMIQRKLDHFASNRRMIFSFELTEMGDQYHISVLSTP